MSIVSSMRRWRLLLVLHSPFVFFSKFESNVKVLPETEMYHEKRLAGERWKQSTQSNRCVRYLSISLTHKISLSQYSTIFGEGNAGQPARKVICTASR